MCSFGPGETFGQIPPADPANKGMGKKVLLGLALLLDTIGPCSGFGLPLPTISRTARSQSARTMSMIGGVPDGHVRRAMWKTEDPGDLKDLKLVSDNLPPPSVDQVRIKVEAVGLNFADVFTALGMYDAAPRGQPVVPGLEFSGIVEEVGERISKPKPQVEVERSKDGRRYVIKNPDQSSEAKPTSSVTRDLRPGDRVMGFTRFGAFSTHVNVPRSFVRKMPEEWSFEQGASFLVQALTAWYGAVELGSASNAKTMLVHSAAGGVGIYALQICKMFGITPVAIVGSEAKVKFIQDTFGLDREQIIVRPWRAAKFQESLDEALRHIGSEGFDIIMDSVAGKYFQPGYDSLAPGGKHILFGAATYTPRGDKGKMWLAPEFWLKIVPLFLSRPKLDVQQMIGENKSVSGFNLIWLTDGKSEPEKLSKMIDELLKPSVRWIPPIVGKAMPFSMAPDALRYFKSGQSVGKVVLGVSDRDARSGSK